MEDLIKLNNRSTVCARLLNPGEATYTCLDCGIDPTCVLCHECFKNSIHVNCNYRMHSTAGGGCCDCGDPEAWKKGVHCSLHSPDASNGQKDVCEIIPEQYKNDLTYKLNLILNYISYFLTSLKQESAVADPRVFCDKSDTTVTVVYNDEAHTYEYVIKMFSKACKSDAKKARDFATIVDREGRSVVMKGDLSSCTAVKSYMEHPENQQRSNYEDSRSSNPLKTCVYKLDLVAHQEFAIFLCAWLSELCSNCEILRVLVSHVLLMDIEQSLCGNLLPYDETFVEFQGSIIDRLVSMDMEMWKSARSSYSKLLINSVLKQTDFKKQFAIKFTRQYVHLSVQNSEDDQDDSFSILSLAVQLYTVPSISLYLIEFEDMLSKQINFLKDKVCDTIESYTSPTDTDKQITLKANKEKLKKELYKYIHIFQNIKYALTTLPSEWNWNLNKKFIEFLERFVLIYGSLEAFDSITRRTGRHLEQEPEWQTGVQTQLRFSIFLNHIINWCGSDHEILLESLKVTIEHLYFSFSEEFPQYEEVEYTSNSYNVLKYDITVKEVSTHYPLTRFLSAILSLASNYEQIRKEDVLSLLPGKKMLELADRSFRSLALCSQTQASAWRRNGLALVNQVSFLFKFIILTLLCIF